MFCSGKGGVLVGDHWFKALKLLSCANHDLTLAHHNPVHSISSTREALPLDVQTTGQTTIGLLNSFQNHTKNSFKFLEHCSMGLLKATLLSREQPLCLIYCMRPIFRASQPKKSMPAVTRRMTCLYWICQIEQGQITIFESICSIKRTNWCNWCKVFVFDFFTHRHRVTCGWISEVVIFLLSCKFSTNVFCEV